MADQIATSRTCMAGSEGGRTTASVATDADAAGGGRRSVCGAVYRPGCRSVHAPPVPRGHTSAMNDPHTVQTDTPRSPASRRVSPWWRALAIVLLLALMLGWAASASLYEQLKAQAIDTRVLFISGYTDDALLDLGVLDDRLSFLEKPFSPPKLAQKVRDILDAGMAVVG